MNAQKQTTLAIPKKYPNMINSDSKTLNLIIQKAKELGRQKDGDLWQSYLYVKEPLALKQHVRLKWVISASHEEAINLPQQSRKSTVIPKKNKKQEVIPRRRPICTFTYRPT